MPVRICMIAFLVSPVASTNLPTKSYFTLLLTVILVALRDDEGKPVLDFASVMGRDFSWPTFWLCAVAVLIGSAMTNAATGITPFLNVMLTPIFSKMSGLMFMIVLMVATVLLTNISNSLVIGMILQPVILTYCAATGTNPAPLISIMIFTVLSSAACTPAASPFAAMMFGNTEWLKSGQIYKNSIIFVVVELAIILTLGVAYINILM